MSIGLFVVMSVGYIILSAIMGIKWGLLYRASGTVWIGLADHFFNNCIVTNLLHVVTENGVDELQIMRVLIGELTFFVAVVLYLTRTNRNHFFHFAQKIVDKFLKRKGMYKINEQI